MTFHKMITQARKQSTILSLLVSLFTFSFYAQAEESYPADPYQLVKTVAGSTFARIEAEQTKIQSNPQILREIMEQELMPHVHHQFAAFKVLGANFRKIPDDKLKEFVVVFREHLLTSYALVLASYDGQEVIFEPVKSSAEQKEVVINSLIKGESRPDIQLVFKLRKVKKTGQWKAYDIVAEGISLISSKRSELAPKIRKDGIQSIIDEMKLQNSKPLKLSS